MTWFRIARVGGDRANFQIRLKNTMSPDLIQWLSTDGKGSAPNA
jgi:hypothetical protein